MLSLPAPTIITESATFTEEQKSHEIKIYFSMFNHAVRDESPDRPKHPQWKDH